MQVPLWEHITLEYIIYCTYSSHIQINSSIDSRHNSAHMELVNTELYARSMQQIWVFITCSFIKYFC